MKFAIETAGYGIVVPAGLAIAVAWSLLRVLPRDIAPLVAGALRCASGFFTGFTALETGNLRPTTYWHWLPWLGAMASVVGPIGLMPRMPTVGRWVHWIAVAIGAGWLLVPTWSDLAPLREVYVAVFSGGVFLPTILLERLARMTSGNMLSLSLCASAFCGAVLMSAFVSLRFGLLAVAAAAAISGCSVVSFRGNARDLVRGMILVHFVIVSGLMLAGQLVAVLPSACFVLIPAAPLMLWPCELLPQPGVTNKRAIAIRAVAIALPLGLAFVVAL
jgi:hypothetical protein